MRELEVECLEWDEKESELSKLNKIVKECIEKKEDKVVGTDEITYFILPNEEIVIEDGCFRGEMIVYKTNIVEFVEEIESNLKEEELH